VLVPSVTPDEAKATTTQAPADTTPETRTASAEPLITPQTVSDDLTNEITPEGEVSTERLRETTLDPSTSEEVVDEEDASDEYVGVTGSSEEEEDESTTEPPEPFSPNNQTSTSSESPLTTAGNSHIPSRLMPKSVNICFMS
jgi:hypothetical protein